MRKEEREGKRREMKRRGGMKGEGKE